MKWAILAAGMSILVPSTVEAKAPATYPPAWGQAQVPNPPTSQLERHRHHYHSGRPSRPGPTSGRVTPSNVSRLQDDVAALKRELAAVKAEVSGRPPERVEKPLPGWMSGLFPLPLGQKRLVEAVEGPNLRLPPLASLPTEPLPAPFSSRSLGSEAVDEVKEARAYLVRTATIGLTMARQGPEVAIGRLHPDFALRLAAAIKRAREAGLGHCGVFSAYRPPAFGIGGFSDKFNSLHSYGLAADIAGIGGPGSKFAKLWQNIVWRVGLYLPYGANNRAEYNHTQLISNKVAASRLRGTITATGPVNLRNMWLASGVPVPAAKPIPVASSAKLPEVDWSQ